MRRSHLLPLLFFFLFFSSGLRATAQVAPIDLPLFPSLLPLPPLPAAEGDDLIAENITVGELRNALYYKESYDYLFLYTTDIINIGNSLAKDYNELGNKYQKHLDWEPLIIGLALVAGFIVGTGATSGGK